LRSAIDIVCIFAGSEKDFFVRVECVTLNEF
jgi:hypothetical protein